MFLTSIQFWIILSIVLILSELVIPGGIVVFLGFAGLIVALCLKQGWVVDSVNVLSTWFISSLILIICLRSLAMKFIGGDFKVSSTNEDDDFIGQEITLLESIDETPGKVFIAGSHWGVTSKEFIEKGSKVKIIKRENINWLVTKIKDES